MLLKVVINNHNVSGYFKPGSLGGLPPLNGVHSFEKHLLSLELRLRGTSPLNSCQMDEDNLKTLEMKMAFLELDRE